MMNKKKDYKIVEEQHSYQTKYVVKKKVFWFFWITVKNNAGFKVIYNTKKGAQAYINFLK